MSIGVEDYSLQYLLKMACSNALGIKLYNDLLSLRCSCFQMHYLA